jgi:glycosyltransferase involved in cell wall biosynthesis
MERLRICQLITELAPAGAERCVYELARRLDRRRFDVRVAALRGGAVADWLAREGIPVHVLGLGWRLDVRKLAKLAGLLRAWRVQLLHTHLFHADLAGRLAADLAGVPRLVHTVHTVEARFRPWQYAFARLWAGRCERVICVSASARRAHARRSGLPAWRYCVIPNGVDVATFQPDPAMRAEMRRQWGIGRGQVLAAYAGRLDYDKGLDVLMSAVAHLGARGGEVQVVIAGQGPLRGAVEKFIACQEGGRVCRYLGFVEDIRLMLWAADLLVMPSRWEGFGLAAAEAMAAGVAVVGTRIPGLSDVVADGQTAVLVAPGDAFALAEAIWRLARDAPLRQRLGQAGMERVARLFPISANVAAHEALYEQLAGGV